MENLRLPTECNCNSNVGVRPRAKIRLNNLEVIPGAERSQIPGVKDNVLVKEKDAEVKEMGAMENYYSEGYKQIQCLLF